jgi:hypothetical protein
MLKRPSSSSSDPTIRPRQPTWYTFGGSFSSFGCTMPISRSLASASRTIAR